MHKALIILALALPMALAAGCSHAPKSTVPQGALPPGVDAATAQKMLSASSSRQNVPSGQGH